jgi:hypothetical protein
MTAELGNCDHISRELDALHDCLFDLDKARFDVANHEWTGRFLRPVWEGPDVQHSRRALLIQVSRVPVVDARLRVRPVSNIRILNDQGIGRYTFNRVERSQNGLRLVFNERMTIDIAWAGEPSGSYEEVPVTGIRAVYRRILFLQTSPVLEIAAVNSSKWT